MYFDYNRFSKFVVKDAIEIMKKRVFMFQNIISNALFRMNLLDIILNNSLMCFKNAYFQQTFGRIMGTNLAPIMPNLYLAMLQEQ